MHNCFPWSLDVIHVELIRWYGCIENYHDYCIFLSYLYTCKKCFARLSVTTWYLTIILMQRINTGKLPVLTQISSSLMQCDVLRLFCFLPHLICFSKIKMNNNINNVFFCLFSLSFSVTIYASPKVHECTLNSKPMTISQNKQLKLSGFA